MQYLLLIYENEQNWAKLERGRSSRRHAKSMARLRRASRPAVTTRAATRFSRPRPQRRCACATASARRPTVRSPKRASSLAATTCRRQGSRRGDPDRGAHPRRAHRFDRGASDHADAGIHAVVTTEDNRELVARVYREDAARVLATLIRLLGDFDAAEEALQDAFAAARRAMGARRTAGESAQRGSSARGDIARSIACGATRASSITRRDPRRTDTSAPPAAAASLDDDSGVDDDRLRLIFTCCHPALSREAQVALTLRTVCGLTTEEIARAFLVPVADDGATAGARDGKNSRRSHSLSRSAGERAARAARRGARGGLSGVHRRLRGDHRRRARPPRAVRRSDSPWAAARNAHARRQRGGGAARA